MSGFVSRQSSHVVQTRSRPAIWSRKMAVGGSPLKTLTVGELRRQPHLFSRVYDYHYQEITSYLFRRTGDHHSTEDLVSQVFLSALGSLPGYLKKSVLIRFWLLRIASNAANRWARNRRVSCLSKPNDVEERCPTSSDSAQANDARAALLQIKPRLQTVLALYYLEGLTIKEIAQVVGCRLGTVKSRLARARSAMQEVVERQGDSHA